MNRLILSSALSTSGSDRQGASSAYQWKLWFEKATSDSTFMWSVFAVLLWFLCGYSMIIFNKLVLSTWHFNYPFFLTAWHTLVATIATQTFSNFYPSVLPGVQEGKVTRRIYFNSLLPASVFFVSGVVLGNSAYAYITVGYIQMIKAITPVPLFLLYVLRGRETPSCLQLSILLVISVGVMIASVGELKFTWIGFTMQISAVVCDCLRLLTTDSFLKDSKIDSLSVLYYTAPTSCVMVTIGWYLVESKSMDWGLFSNKFMLILLANGLLAFSLNFAALFAMKSTSGMVVAVCGPMKDILVIITSAVCFASPVTSLQLFGFSISLTGLLLYQQYKKDPIVFAHQALETVYWLDQQSPCPSLSSKTSSIPEQGDTEKGLKQEEIQGQAELEEEERQGLLMSTLTAPASSK